MTRLLSLAASLTLVALAGCAAPPVPASQVRFAADAPARDFTGLARCNASARDVIDIDPDQPLTILVHGCRSSVGRFRALANVFEAHGQQTLCFGYDDRDRIEDVAGNLANTVQSLEREMRSRDVTIIAHSQGGLIARRAFTEELRGAPEAPFRSDLRLITISSPFAGIHSARDCGKRWLHGLTLGITMAVCRGIAGRTWREINDRSELVRNPGTLRPSVRTYLQLRTDERETCRTRSASGECVESDFVFSLAEQANPATIGTRTDVQEVRAGHVEIVGNENVAPMKLIALLRRERVLAELPPDRAEAFSALLIELYGRGPAQQASADAQ